MVHRMVHFPTCGLRRLSVVWGRLRGADDVCSCLDVNETFQSPESERVRRNLAQLIGGAAGLDPGGACRTRRHEPAQHQRTGARRRRHPAARHGGATRPGTRPGRAASSPSSRRWSSVDAPPRSAPGGRQFTRVDDCRPGDDVSHHNLPRSLNSFVGREQEMRELGPILTTAPLVTLVGAGGVGKTRLAPRAGPPARVEVRRRRLAGRAGRAHRAVAWSPAPSRPPWGCATCTSHATVARA